MMTRWARASDALPHLLGTERYPFQQLPRLRCDHRARRGHIPKGPCMTHPSDEGHPTNGIYPGLSNVITEPLGCPYTRPFEHPIDCECSECEMSNENRFYFIAGAGLVLVAVLVLTGVIADTTGTIIGGIILGAIAICAALNGSTDVDDPNEEPRP
jgi:hypothetical protein